MRVILHDGVRGLGKAGDVVDVKPGYARNFLIPKGAAVAASPANLKALEEKRSLIEANNLVKFEKACTIADGIRGRYVSIIKFAGEDSKLFGSVTARDISAALSEIGFDVHRGSVILNDVIRYLGDHRVQLNLHHDVLVDLRVLVVRSASELLSIIGKDKEVSSAEDNRSDYAFAMESASSLEEPKDTSEAPESANDLASS